MKAIKITEANKDLIARTLKDLGQRGGQGNLTASEIIDAAARAERQMEEMHIAKSKRPGARYVICEGGAAASSYRYPIAVTRGYLERKSSGWYLVDLERDNKYPKARAEADLLISKQQEEAILSGFRRSKMYYRDPTKKWTD